MIAATSLLTANGGHLSLALYGGQSEDAVLMQLSQSLTVGYANALARGIAAVDADDVAAYWAYAAWYQGAADRMATSPMDVDVKDSVSRSWNSAQLQYLQGRAAYWLSLYEQALDAATPEDEETEGWASITSLRSV